MKSKLFNYFGALAMLMMLCGCVHAVEEQVQTAGFSEKADDKFDPIDSSDLAIEIVGKREKIAAPNQKICFKLVNNGKKSITIDEWHLNEMENFSVECQVWVPNTTDPDPDGWIEITERPEKLSHYYPLTLAPGNMALIDVPLNFLSTLVISPNAERRYFIRIKSALKSLNIESKVEAFIVRPE